MRSLSVVALVCVIGVAGAIVGPAWTNDPAAEKPAGEKDMGGYTISVYTPEQQARLGVDEMGAPLAKQPETNDCKMPTNAYPPPANTSLPWYTVDLDEDPADRWTHIVTLFGTQIHDMVYSVIDMLPPKLAQDLINRIAAKQDEILAAFPYPYGDELRGISAAINMDIPSLVLYNIAYELEGGCTSMVVENAQNVPIHARNLDFGLFLGWDKVNRTWQLAERLRPLLFNARFIKGGETVYNATYFAGFVGLLSGMKTGGFSITVDTRYDNTFYKGLVNWIEGDHSGHFLTFLTRSVMEQNQTYAEALVALNTTKMVGPSFIILGGVNPGEGAVITRGEANSYNLWTIENNLHNTNYYVLETNYDHWVTPPFYDNRVKPAEDCLAQVGQANIDFGSIFNILSGQPNLNLLTTYTAIMCPATGRYEAYIQQCKTHPCTPW